MVSLTSGDTFPNTSLYSQSSDLSLAEAHSFPPSRLSNLSVVIRTCDGFQFSDIGCNDAREIRTLALI